jgi:hypothetical protein
MKLRHHGKFQFAAQNSPETYGKPAEILGRKEKNNLSKILSFSLAAHSILSVGLVA